jgi:UDP-glucuronate 4-epimerase
MLLDHPGFRAVEGLVETPGLVAELMADTPDAVFHLAAQAGVRHSIEAPRAYLEGNLMGCFEVLEAARATPAFELI